MTETDEVLRNEAFDDDTKRAVCEAFNGAWLWLLATTNPLANTKRYPEIRRLLARRIIGAARMGMKYPNELKYEGLNYLQKTFMPNWPREG